MINKSRVVRPFPPRHTSGWKGSGYARLEINSKNKQAKFYVYILIANKYSSEYDATNKEIELNVDVDKAYVPLCVTGILFCKNQEHLPKSLSPFRDHFE